MPLQGEFVLKKDTDQPEQEEVRAQPPEPAIKTNAVIPQKNHVSMFTTLCKSPADVEFQDQEEGEEVLLIVRRDFITNFPWILMVGVLILLPIVFMFLSFLFPFISLTINTDIGLVFFYYLALFGFTLINFSIWYFNIGIITNLRILDINVAGILFRNVSETELESIHDVSYSQVGTIQSIFNYGDVYLEIIADKESFAFRNVPEPAKITNFMSDLLERNKG